MAARGENGRRALILTLMLLLLLPALLTNTVSAQSDTTTTSTTTSTYIPAGANCSDTRLRKSWDAYNSTEKALYIAAITDAIKSGYHVKFVELHTEYWSEREAHSTTVFIYWHRMFLLGYENMLRSLNPSYACVTLPVWDHLSLAASYAAKKCSSLQGCSSLLTALGGYSSGTKASMLVLNFTVPYSTSSTAPSRCISNGPLVNYCGSLTSKVCGKCIVRGSLGQTYPTSAQFASVYQQMFTYNTWADFTNQVEKGVHNTVHSTLGGAMAYLQSPVDPIFFSHHAFIDVLQVIYLKCQLGAEKVYLTSDQKSSDTRFWSNGPRRTTGYFYASDKITMRTRATDNSTWVHVQNSNNILYPFFKDLPSTYGEYVDAKDLGVYSYSYAISGSLANMYTNCKNSNTIQATDSIAYTSLLSSDDQPSGQQTSSFGDGNGNGEDDQDGPSPKILPPTISDVTMQYWTIAIYEAAKIVGYTEDAAKDQMELIMCQHKEECLGGTDDYTDLFRANFMAEGHPRCFTLIEDLKSGDRVIGVPKWRSITSRFLPCPIRKRMFVRSCVE